MKNIILLVLATTLFNACQNDDDYHYEWPSDEIAFPDEGIYGLNVLNENTTEFKTYDDTAEGPWYSFMASVPINTTIKVTLENTSSNTDENMWGWSSAFRDWDDYYNAPEADENTRVLIVYGQEVANARIRFGRDNPSGSATIKFYKNDENRPFRTKKITWKP